MTKKRTKNTKHGRKNKKTEARRRLWFIIAACIIIAVVIGAILSRDLILRRIFPLKYGAEVAAGSKDYELDRWLVYAVIKVESDFVPDAVSGAGAVGLMQLMPDTAEWIAWRRQEEYFPENLTMPEYNIGMGCYLLSYLLDYYDGDIDLAIAAYNAGSGKVDEWIASGEIEDIPYPETKAYVAKVKYTYEKYKKLYS